MKKGILKAIGFMLLIGLIYLLANILVTFGFIVLVMIQNPTILSDNTDRIIVGFLEGLSPYLLHIVIGANLLSLLMIALFFLARKDKLMTYCKFNKIKFVDGLFITFLGVFMNLLFISLLSAISYVEAFSQTLDEYSQLMEPLLDGPFYIMFIAIAVVAPIYEEIIMRGIILNDFKKVTPVWVAVLIQALAFGIMHFNIVQSTYAAILGIVLGVIYIKYNSIWMPILFHFAFNFTSLVTDSILGEDFPLILLGIIGVVGSIIFTFFAKHNYKSQFYKEKELETDNLEERLEASYD